MVADGCAHTACISTWQVMLVGALRDVEGEDEARILAARKREEAHQAAIARQRRAALLLARSMRQPVIRHGAGMSAALHRWRTAVYMAEAGENFAALAERTTALLEQTDAVAGQLEHLQLHESGALATAQMQTLHDNWKDVVLTELHSTETEAASAKASLAAASAKLQRREDDLVLMLHRYGVLEAAHKELAAEVEAASEGDAMESARLRIEHAAATEAASAAEAGLASERDAAERLRADLRLREQQLSAVVAHVDAAKAEAAHRVAAAGEDAAQLRTALGERNGQLVALVQELCVLAAEEKTPGQICHESRSRLFRRSAALFQSLTDQGVVAS